MNYIRNKKNRLLLSVLIAALAAFLTVSAPNVSGKQSVLAWWGTLYPEFCFVKTEDSDDISPRSHVKISFWLAKALNW